MCLSDCVLERTTLKGHTEVRLVRGTSQRSAETCDMITGCKVCNKVESVQFKFCDVELQPRRRLRGHAMSIIDYCTWHAHLTSFQTKNKKIKK